MKNTALITGASGGLGRGLAFALARRGWHIILTGRNASRLAQVQAEIQVISSVETHLLDLADLPAVENFCNLLNNTVGAPGLLINNAACLPNGDFGAQPESEIQAAMTTNLLSPALMTRMFCAGQAPTQAVIFILSNAGRFPQPFNSVYSASKTGLRSLAECLQVELGSSTRICLAYPPIMATSLTSQFRKTSNLLPIANPLHISEKIIKAFEQGQNEITWLNWEGIPILFYQFAPRLFRKLLLSQRQRLRNLLSSTTPPAKEK
jgi:short-subunit dehydrogenase